MTRRAFIALLGGTAIAWPLTAACAATAPVIGFLRTGPPGPKAHIVTAFRKGLGETGYIEGRNVGIEYDGRTIIMIGNDQGGVPIKRMARGAPGASPLLSAPYCLASSFFLMYDPNYLDRRGQGLAMLESKGREGLTESLSFWAQDRGGQQRFAGRIMRSPREVFVRPIMLSVVLILLTSLVVAEVLPTIFIAVFFGSTLAVAASFASGLAAAYFIYPPQVSIWIEDPNHVAELGFILLLAITASKAVGVIIDDRPLGVPRRRP